MKTQPLSMRTNWQAAPTRPSGHPSPPRPPSDPNAPCPKNRLRTVPRIAGDPNTVPPSLREALCAEACAHTPEKLRMTGAGWLGPGPVGNAKDSTQMVL